MEDLGIDRKFLNVSQARPLSSVIGSYTYFAEGDVLLAKITPCFENGKLGIAKGLTNGIGFGSSEFLVLRPGRDLDREYLYYYLSRVGFRSEGAARMGGAVGQQRVPKEFIESYPIPYPPRSEQRRIVGILDKAFEGIAIAKANTEKNLKNARAIFESYLNEIFTKKGEGWVERKLKDICEAITDGTHQTPTYFERGIVFLSSRNVTKGKVDWNNIKYIDEKQHREMHRRVAPRLNDILLAKNGTTGVAAIVDRDITFDIYVSLALLRSKSDVAPQFLLYFINSPIAKQQFNKRLKGIGVPNLHLEEIREVVIAYPKSVALQKKIAADLDVFRIETQKVITICERKIGLLEALKKSLLHQAFTGGL